MAEPAFLMCRDLTKGASHRDPKGSPRIFSALETNQKTLLCPRRDDPLLTFFKLYVLPAVVVGVP